jgi:pimeloyl-ACP methyl ester carboxylesterase
VGRTRVLTRGEGPPALLLHGNPDSADEWRGVMEILGETHRCVAPDLPGYGTSPLAHDFDYSIDAQIAFVDEVLAALEVDEPVLLVVHDVGGPMGIAWAATHVSAVRAMLVINTNVFPDFEWFPIAKRWGSHSVVGRMRAAFGMRAIGHGGGKIFKKIFRSQSPEVSEFDADRIIHGFALNEIAKATTLVHFREMLRPGFFADFGAWISRVTVSVPTHVLWGGGDPYLQDKLAHRFGHASTTLVPDGGHWLPLSQPELVAKSAQLVSGKLFGGAC